MLLIIAKGIRKSLIFSHPLGRFVPIICSPCAKGCAICSLNQSILFITSMHCSLKKMDSTLTGEYSCRLLHRWGQYLAYPKLPNQIMIKSDPLGNEEEIPL